MMSPHSGSRIHGHRIARWLLVGALLLTGGGCGGKQVVGKWELDRAATRKHFPSSNLLRGNLATIRFDITFSDDGTVVFDVAGQIKQSGKWQYRMGNYLITMAGQGYSLRMEDGLLIDNTINKSQGAAFRRAAVASAPMDEKNNTGVPDGGIPDAADNGNPDGGANTKSPGRNLSSPFQQTKKTPNAFTPPSSTFKRPPVAVRKTPTRSRSTTRTRSVSPPPKLDNERRRIDITGGVAMSYSADGKKLLVCLGQDAALFDLEQGDKTLPRRTTFANACTQLVFSRDGVRALAWGSGKEAYVFDPAKGQVLVTIPHDQRLTAAGISPNGKVVVTGGSSFDNVKLWDAESGQEIGRYTKKKADALSIDFGDSNDQLYVGDAQGYSIISAKDGREITRVDFLAGTRIRNMAISSSQQRAVVGAAIWDLNDGAEVAKIVENEPWGTKLAFSRGPWLAMSDGWAKDVKLIDHRTAKTEKTIGPLPDRVAAVAITPDGKEMAVATRQSIHIVGLPDPPSAPKVAIAPQPKLVDNGRVQEVRKMKTPTSFYRAAVAELSPDATFALVGSSVQTYFYDVASGRRLGTRPFEGQKSVFSIDFTADGEVAITGDTEGGVYIWNTTSGQKISQLTGHSRGKVFVSISADGSTAITGSERDEEELVSWNVGGSTPKVLSTLKGHVKDLIAVHAMNNGFGASISTHAVAVWTLSTGKNYSVSAIAPKLGIQQGRFADFTTDGRLALIGMREGYQLWDVSKKKAVVASSNRDLRLEAVALASDGRFGVMYNGADRTITVWDFGLKKEIDNFKPEHPVASIDVSLDGRQFMTSSSYGHVILYQMPKLGELPAANQE